MANPELGLKRTCVECGARFYDLNRAPGVCPKCGAAQPTDLARLKRRDDALPDEKAKVLPEDEREDDVDLDTAADDTDDVIDPDDDLGDDDDISSDIEVTTDKDERDDQ